MDDYYVQALKSMQYIIKCNDSLSLDNWIVWIAKEMWEWENKRNVAHHLTAYGGMGSFNDLPPLKGGNGNYEIVFDFLKSFCYRFGHLYDKYPISIEVLQEDCLQDIDNESHHPYKKINRQIKQYLKLGTLPDKIDFII